MYTKTYKPTFY